MLMVTPYAGVWIEILVTSVVFANITVTPYAGVWIEIRTRFERFGSVTSLPTRECGLKSQMFRDFSTLLTVTPYAGVWIEISSNVP